MEWGAFRDAKIQGHALVASVHAHAVHVSNIMGLKLFYPQHHVMKQSIILLIGFGIPAELSEVLLRQGFEVRRADNPLSACLALIKGDIHLVLVVGAMDEEWNDFIDAAQGANRLMHVEHLVALQTTLASANVANGNGSNGNGSNGNGKNGKHDHDNVGMSVDEVVEALNQRFDSPEPSENHIYTKVGNKLRKVKLDDILYIEVEGKYSALQVNDRKFNVKASLKDLLHKLPPNRFVRVSRNFVVNLNRIQHIDTFQYTIKVGEVEIPISRTYKEELMRHINLI